MENSDRKPGKIFLVFVGICILALPLIVFSAFSSEPDEPEMEGAGFGMKSLAFDHNGGAIFENYDKISRDYLEGTSTNRTLSQYYSRRQYAGSPPFIPHKNLDPDESRVKCLTCHAKGGWTAELEKNTPLTPHPEYESCRQCHAKTVTEQPWVINDWMSSPPPRLGRSHLPGAPPPIPHDLQMRGNCIACHVGPGAVTNIRVEHPSRGNCRQCHVPDLHAGLFTRESEY